MRNAPLIALAVAGCAAPSPPSPGTIAGEDPIAERGAGTCRADRAAGLVGRTADAALGRDAKAMTGASMLRWIPPHAAVTMDYRQDRVNVAYDDRMIVTRVHCG